MNVQFTVHEFTAHEFTVPVPSSEQEL